MRESRFFGIVCLDMTQIIAIIIAVIVLIVGFIIYQVGLQILDEGDYFFYAVGFFLALFAICGVALYFLLPRPSGPADLTTLTPARLGGAFNEIASRATNGRIVSYSMDSGVE